MKYNKGKLQLRMFEVPYTGHLFTYDGLKPDLRKTLVIQQMQKPNDVAALQRYLDFCLDFYLNYLL